MTGCKVHFGKNVQSFTHDGRGVHKYRLWIKIENTAWIRPSLKSRRDLFFFTGENDGNILQVLHGRSSSFVMIISWRPLVCAINVRCSDTSVNMSRIS